MIITLEHINRRVLIFKLEEFFDKTITCKLRYKAPAFKNLKMPIFWLMFDISLSGPRLPLSEKTSDSGKIQEKSFVLKAALIPDYS